MGVTRHHSCREWKGKFGERNECLLSRQSGSRVSSCLEAWSGRLDHGNLTKDSALIPDGESTEAEESCTAKRMFGMIIMTCAVRTARKRERRCWKVWFTRRAKSSKEKSIVSQMNQKLVSSWLGVMLVELVHELLVSVARGGWKHRKLSESWVKGRHISKPDGHAQLPKKQQGWREKIKPS